MKRIISAIFIFSLLFTVTACGNGGAGAASGQTEKTESESSQITADISSKDEQVEAAEPLESETETAETLENGTGTTDDDNNNGDSHMGREEHTA